MSNKIGILNTSIATENTGDHIIMRSALNELAPVLKNNLSIHFPTHEKISRKSYTIQSKLDFNIACGTNLLHAHMGIIKQWNIGFLDTFFMKPVVLMGVGWRSQSKRKTDPYTKWLLHRLLSDKFIHSVRDSYAEEQLRSIGFDNVLNTGCPTTWCLDKKHCDTIPRKKGKNAVLVLTDYSKNHELDSALANHALANYEQVFYWPQGTGDIEYARELGLNDKLNMIGSDLESYDALLSDRELSLDYIGTRLHGGIRALQNSRRAVIIGVDHRANSMGADFNLPVIDRYKNMDAIFEMINGELGLDIQLPFDSISTWKEQFITPT